jgi:MSHA biogenesis protein MshM
MFGQPELDRLLDQTNLRQLRQRMSFSYRLKALTLKGTHSYIKHRIVTAGYERETLFTDKAIKLAFQASGGIPRLINILCHKALMSAYGKGDERIGVVHVQAAIDDTEGVETPASLFWGWRASALAVFNVSLLSILSLDGIVL